MPPRGKLIELAPNLLSFHCPGCRYGHAVAVNGRTMPGSDGKPNSWTWNGSYAAPSFHPSLLINKAKEGGYPLCHTWIKDGKIQFLPDCTHALAGKTVEMEDAT
jgi:hypothetical protein